MLLFIKYSKLRERDLKAFCDIFLSGFLKLSFGKFKSELILSNNKFKSTNENIDSIYLFLSLSL